MIAATNMTTTIITGGAGNGNGDHVYGNNDGHGDNHDGGDGNDHSGGRGDDLDIN